MKKLQKYFQKQARITNIAFLREGFVEVSFVDYGNRDVVPYANIRSLQNFPSSFISIPPLATGFIFAEAHCPGGGEWNDTIFENISKEIKYREVQCTLLIQATQYFLIKIFIGGTDLCGMLISRGFMQPISLQAQQAVLLSMSMQRQAVSAQSVAPTSAGINTYKACTLEPGCQYPVYVSYVNDGPCHFSVQLKQSEEILVMLMNDINNITLRLLEDIPIPGTICLSRCQEDGNVCRAVVTNEVDNQFKVFYVDFGNYEVVPLDALYQIPFKYVLPKVMAIRFSLAGIEKSTVTLEMRCAFKQFVDNRLLHMKVLPTPTRTALPKCQLWDPETKTSALDVVQRAARHAYPDPISLNRGFSQPVKVSYVYSCNRFYVQLANKENELLNLMLDLQSICQTNDLMDPCSIKVGLPCCALFVSDQQWYRSQIVEVMGDNVKVRYIDYGNEETVPISQLKIIDGEQLTVLRPQAIECCLNGYQNMNEDLERDGILEELILEGSFTMKVVEMTNKKALVELFDNNNYNVSSLLLDKLAAAKSQVSPMLVQAGNKIEHRKSFSHQNGPREQNFRQDRKPGRDYKSYDKNERNDRGERIERSDRNEKSWRQENKDYRSYDRHSNENFNDRGSWRDNNKGFSPNHERYNRDRSKNRNERSEKPNAVESGDSWETVDTNNQVQASNDDWNMPETNVQNNTKANNFGHGKNRVDNDKENWNSGGHKGGFKKRNDFRKDGSEVSSSGSETSFQRGPRTSSRNEQRSKYQKKFDKPRNASFNNTCTTNDSWNVSVVATHSDAAPVTAAYQPYNSVGIESKVVISWFHNPSHFYCQQIAVRDQFHTMMEEIQHKPEKSVVGAPVIGLFPEDNVLYRAQVLEVIGSQYKVYYVDFGNVSTISKVWPIEKKFMNLPAQAIICSLNAIAPPNGQWQDADCYSKYFNKDIFECRVVDNDEEKTYVNLIHGNDDIRQLLIQDELAVSTNIVIDIDLPILLGQQFRAIVKSINNLSDIIIALECGVAVSCKMHNVEDATETFEETLKGLLEQTVIVFVDNVIDDRLEITLYDTEGSKINIVSPDEGAYDTVEVLCPPLVYRSTITGYVSHAEDTVVYIQLTEYTDAIANLLDQMFERYNAENAELPIIPEEGLVYAVHSQDGNWYRGKVISFDDEQATVNYVDYGNSESVNFSELRELDDTFLRNCILCVMVNVGSPTDILIDKDVIGQITYGENGWEGAVIPQTPGELSATQLVEERGEAAGMMVPEPVNEYDENVVYETAPIQEVALEKTDAPSEVLPDSTTETGAAKGTEVLISHVDSPTEFYLQLIESQNAIRDLQSNLQEQVLEMPILENPVAGALCAALYSGNQLWYRAEVLDADDDITTVRFIDYGNTDVIDNKTTQTRTLPPNLLSLAVYASRCSLKVKSPDEEWSSGSIKAFEALATSESVTVEFVNQDEKTNYVELYSKGKNIKDILISENLALPMKTVESKSTCFLSHLNSPSEFWIQLENCVDELEWIAEQLSTSENFPELEDLTPGTLCAALFPDDEMWYRARILSNTVAGIELLFIDYGNSCVSSSLRQLPEDLVVTPPLAQKCSLQRPEGVPYWTPQAVTRFSEISAEGQTIFTVRKISTGETSVVQLLIDGDDVTTMLAPTTEDGYIKGIEDLGSLNIEKDGESLPESYSLEAMPGTTWTDESKSKLEEMSKQGTTLFQIEFLAENTVRLYLDGNDIRPNLGAVKTVPLNLSRSDIEEEQPDYETDSQPYLAEAALDEKCLENVDVAPKIESDKVCENQDENKLQNEALLDASGSEICDSENKNETNIAEPKEELTQNSSQVHVDSDITRKTIASETLGETIKDVEEIPVTQTGESHSPDHTQTPILSPEKSVSVDTAGDNLDVHSVASLLHQEIEKALDKADTEKDVPHKNKTLESEHVKEVQDTSVSIERDSSPPESAKQTVEETVTTSRQDEVEVRSGLSTNVNAEVISLLHSEIEKALDKKDSETSRPSSRCSQKIRHDDRIPSAIISRSHTPVDDPNSDDTAQETKEQDNVKASSRPQSSCSGKINFDERIVPAAVSRPQSPLQSSDENESQKNNDAK
ncbi:hypothetical protein NQ318_000749 [Aromia moschata]|uniref:Tudor domain-containing protein n=1 Tax=Aromia moschata TaxID=1265417 RepID=A0AAV8YUD1_9CUCU|nr:hypothetical protein NQ318_000749 [Aromia moschata]